MRIWLVTVGEPLPIDGDNPRLHRTGINSSFLSGRGHEVVYWSGTFDHFSKTDRSDRDLDFQAPQDYRVIAIHAGTYTRNVSLERIRYHRDVAKRFRKMALEHKQPDIIVVSLTPLETARAVVEYGRERNIPVIVDVRDLWPDIWAEKLPGPLKLLRHILLKPFYDDLKHAVRGATSIIGITDSAVDWAMTSTGRTRGPKDRGFPLVYTADKPAEADVVEADNYWRAQGVGTNSDEIIGCFFGTFTTRVDFETPLKALTEMPERLRARVKLVLCGRGENDELIAHYAALTPQIVNAGWVEAPHIVALMRLSRFGLLPYPPTIDFSRSLPNKVFEYLNGGLPILTSLRGEIEVLFDAHNCGAFYEIGSPPSFAKLLEALIADPSQLDVMAKGAAQAAQAYDSVRVCETFEAYLKELVLAAK